MKTIEYLEIFEKEYYEIIEKIIKNEEFQKRKQYHHHNNRSVFDHSLMVSYKSYKITKTLGLDYKSAAIGGLLHDFYYKDWQQNYEKKPFLKQHGFTHAKEALENSKKTFENEMNKKIENIILRHMFPLNITPPKYLESWIVSMVDKYVSLEILKDIKSIHKYLGIRKKNQKEEVIENE